MSTSDLAPQPFADRPSAAVTGLGSLSIHYAITLGQNARRVVARVRAVSAVEAVRAYSMQTGIPSPFVNAAEIA